MKRILLGLAMLATCFTLTGCFGIIDQGNVGVRTSFGKIDQEPVTGMYQTFVSSVNIYTTKETNVSISGMKPRAADNLTLDDLDVVIYYTTNPAKLPNFQATTAGQSAKVGEDDFLRPGYVMIDTLAHNLRQSTRWIAKITTKAMSRATFAGRPVKSRAATPAATSMSRLAIKR